MLTLDQMVGMIKLPGDNAIDNETLYRLLQIDASVAEMQQRLTQCGHLIKLLYGYNPDLPMGPGMKAQFQELMKEIENGR